MVEFLKTQMENVVQMAMEKTKATESKLAVALQRLSDSRKRVQQLEGSNSVPPS